MINAIGLRCTPHEIYYSVIQQTDEMKVINADIILLPKSMNKSEQLKYARNTMIDVIREYNISKAGIRVYENTAQTFDRDRVYLEGVFIELLASVDLRCYYVGQISNISSRIGINRDCFKLIVQGKMPYTEIQNFDAFKLEHKESTLTAIGALLC